MQPATHSRPIEIGLARFVQLCGYGKAVRHRRQRPPIEQPGRHRARPAPPRPHAGHVRRRMLRRVDRRNGDDAPGWMTTGPYLHDRPTIVEPAGSRTSG